MRCSKYTDSGRDINLLLSCRGINGALFPAQRGVQLIKEKFSLDKTVSNYEALYAGLYKQKMNGKADL